MEKYFKQSKTEIELIRKTVADLAKKRQLYQKVDVSKLPDKGVKLQSQIEKLEKSLQDLNLSNECHAKNITPVCEDVQKSPGGNISIDSKSNTGNKDSGISELNNGEMDKIFKQSKTELELLIHETVADLAEKRKEYESVDASELPDKCVKLQSQIKKLENLLQDLNSSKECRAKNITSGYGDVQKSSGNNISIDSKSYGGNEDSGFHELRNTPKNHPKFFKVDSDVSSFAKLSEKTPKDNSFLSEKTNTPSFKHYRHTEAIPSIKFTEAKPLFEKDVTKKCWRNDYLNTHSPCFTDEETVKQLHGCLTIYPEDAQEESQPKYIKTCLMDHQLKALSWLIWRESQIPSGGILADDMGLGKTLTMISLMLKQREKNNFSDDKEKSTVNSKGTLVVCVASVLHQWQNEIIKHCKPDSVTVLLYHGPKRDRGNVDFMQRHDVVLTTYSILLSEFKVLHLGKKSGLFELKWERIILDEAHTIKNHSTQTAGAVFSLQSFKKWCVTGTPIHNDFKDMYSLINFLKFVPFDDYKKFKKLTDDQTKASDDRRNMLVKSILLRRTKNDVDEAGKPLVEIRKKSTSITYIELCEEERKVYDDLDEKTKDIINKFLNKSSKQFCNSSSLLVLLLRLQQCCNHVSLLGKETEEVVNNSLMDISTGLSSLSIGDDSRRESGSESSLDLTFSELENININDQSVKSTKIRKLFDELNKIAEESNNTFKNVIVSQWVSMLELIKMYLEREGKTYHMIVGSTKVEDRQIMADDFNNNPDGCKIMLLSLKAGGVGLNLVGASHLFLLDLHWNPALESQASDRIHRVGSKHDVFIHKFVCKNTIEERILALQEKKRELASDVLFGAGKVKKGLSMEDFKSLFNVKL